MATNDDRDAHGMTDDDYYRYERMARRFNNVRKICDDYKRPDGVMGGPCLRCGASQPEHVKETK